MEGTIDSIQIEIDASTDQAEQKLKRITSMLKDLKQNSSGLGFSAIANSIHGIGSAASDSERKVRNLMSRLDELKKDFGTFKGINLKQVLNESGGSLSGWNAEKLMGMGQYEQLDRRLGILMSKMEEAAAKGNDLQAMNLASQANRIQAKLSDLEESAGQTASRFDRLRESIKRSSDSSLLQGFKHLEKAVKGIVLYRVIRSGIKYISDGFHEGLQNAYAFSQAIGGELAGTLDRLSGAGLTLKNQLGAAFGGLIQALEPILIRIIELATGAADALSQLMAAIAGKNVYKKAASQAKQYSSAATDAAKAAKEWKNQLMGFDEINRLENAVDSSSGGVGGGLSSALDDFDYAKIGDFWKRVSDLFSSLKLSIRDVFFDWKNLNPEKIAEKAIVGLSAILGGVTGFAIGGIPGAVIGTIGGVTAGLLIDSVIFNHDGVLSRGEIAEMLSGALFGLAGGVIGFFAGGPMGALVGASVGVGLFATLKSIDFLTEGKYSKVADQFATALTVLTGAAIGFTVGGPAGALLGATIGLGITAVIESLKFDNKNEGLKSQYKNGLSWFICGVLGLPTDTEWKEYGKKAIDWLAEGFSDFLTEIHNIIGHPLEELIEVEIPDTVQFFKDLGPKALLWLGEGFMDWTEEIHNVIGGPLEKLIDEDIPETIEFFKDLGPKAVTFIREGLLDFGTELYNIFVQPFYDMWNGLKTWWDGLSLGAFHIPRPVFDWTYTEATGALAKAMQFVGLPTSIPHLNISWYAQGGFPEDGLFMANHGELVGQFSNGRTAVANNEQITEGIASAVYDAFMAAFSQTSGNGGNDRPVNIYLDGRLIARSTTKYQEQFARASGM